MSYTEDHLIEQPIIQTEHELGLVNAYDKWMGGSVHLASSSFQTTVP